MKRTIAKILTTVFLVMMCSSCEMETEKFFSRVELSVGEWSVAESEKISSLNKQKEVFEKQNPNITIVPDVWTFDIKTFYPKLEAGLLPNVFRTFFTESKRLIDGGYLADLTDVLKERGYYDKYNERLLDVISKDGRIYAMPSDVYLIGLVYNTDMYEAAGLVEPDGTPKQPETWNELAEFAVKIKEATGKPGFALTTAEYDGGWLLTNIAWSYGVDFMEQDEKGKWWATFNTPEMVETLQFVSDLKWKYDVLPEITYIDQYEQRRMYSNGEVGMILNAPFINLEMVKYKADPKMLGMMAIPAGPKRHVALMGGVLYCVSEGSSPEQIDAAVKWLEYSNVGIRQENTTEEHLEKTYKNYISENRAIGVENMPKWNDKVSTGQEKYREAMYNLKPNAVRLYNECLKNPNLEFQTEEPVYAQELYAILDVCIQEVLTNKDADIQAIVEKANRDFQENFLDNIQNK